MVRLFVGRSNPNGDENRAFAQEIKAVADEEYPGLVKDIYIGKGNYNQELYPRALLLEMGTHEIEKEKAMASTDYIADVISEVLYGESAKAEESAEQSGAASGVFWVIGAVIVIAVVYALASTGRLSAIWDKIRRAGSEMTGETASVRSGDVRIERSSYRGLQVNRDAVHIEQRTRTVTNDDGTTRTETVEVQGVYVVYGEQVRFREIAPLYWGEDIVICDASATRTADAAMLKQYDQVISGGRNLYDGKSIV